MDVMQFVPATVIVIHIQEQQHVVVIQHVTIVDVMDNVTIVLAIVHATIADVMDNVTTVDVMIILVQLHVVVIVHQIAHVMDKHLVVVIVHQIVLA